MTHDSIPRDEGPLVARWWFWLVALMVVYFLVARAPLPLVHSWWQAGQDDWGDRLNRRHRMADWMLLTRSLAGLTREEVVARLGDPPPTNYFRDWSMVYNLGAERGFFSIDSEWLVIRLDDSGQVSEARIVTD